jgi:hypothetical protein
MITKELKIRLETYEKGAYNLKVLFHGRVVM